MPPRTFVRGKRCSLHESESVLGVRDRWASPSIDARLRCLRARTTRRRRLVRAHRRRIADRCQRTSGRCAPTAAPWCCSAAPSATTPTGAKRRRVPHLRGVRRAGGARARRVDRPEMQAPLAGRRAHRRSCIGRGASSSAPARSSWSVGSASTRGVRGGAGSRSTRSRHRCRSGSTRCGPTAPTGAPVRPNCRSRRRSTCRRRGRRLVVVVVVAIVAASLVIARRCCRTGSLARAGCRRVVPSPDRRAVARGAPQRRRPGEPDPTTRRPTMTDADTARDPPDVHGT